MHSCQNNLFLILYLQIEIFIYLRSYQLIIVEHE